MSADKRSVTTDALLTLGTIHEEQQYRDAIHLGVEPVIAGDVLYAGEHIGIGKDGKAYGGATPNIKPLGIVDPFLVDPVYEGDAFWLVVYPRQITSLHHVWEHPDFPASVPESTDISTISNEALMQELAGRMKNDIVIKDAPEKNESLYTEEENIKQRAFNWIDNYANSLGLDTELLLSYADEWVEDKGNGSYLVQGGLLEGEYVTQEFWDNYSTFKNIDVPDNYRTNFFSCSC